MDPSTAPPDPSAEDLFAAFLERIEAGEVVDFEAWAANQPGDRRHLRRLHQRWRAMTIAFTSMSQSPASAAATTTASASMTTLLARLGSQGSRTARYAVGAEIARGGMGRVVVAWDQELRREVALKIQRDDGDGRMRRRFVEEAQIAAQLDHPGIVPIHELGTDAEGRPFFAMRLVRGRDLDDVLRLHREGSEGWSRTRVLHVLLRVGEAMAYAHHKGVVHRDLKPANVMVGPFGETYVMDWGLARVLGKEPTAAAAAGELDTVRAQIAAEDDVSPLLTRTGDVVGTPTYMAPEQAAGGPLAATPAADVYSLGAILYHLLAGVAPYRTASDHGNADRVLAALRAGPPALLPDDTPDELRAICERAMARDPAQRYPGVAALTDDLRAFLDGRVVSAHAQGPLAELRKWITRNRALAAMSAVFVASLTLGAITTTWLWLEAERARRHSDRTGAELGAELDRSQFRNARLAMRSDDASNAGDVLWQHHLAGHMPRATQWALRELAERNPLLATRPLGGIGQPAFSWQRDVLLVDGGDTLLVLDPQTLATAHHLSRAGTQLTALAASSTRPLAVTGDRDGDVVMWDLERRTVQRVSSEHEGVIENIVFAPDGIGFATADDRGRVVWWADAAAEPAVLARLGTRVCSLACDTIGARIAAGTDTSMVIVSDPTGVRPLQRLHIEDRPVSLSFAADGRQLWVGGRTVSIVDLRTGAVTHQGATRNGTCRQLAHDSDGSVLAGGWWRVDRLAADHLTEVPLALQGVWRFAFDRTARRLISKREGAGLDLIDVSQADLRQVSTGGTIALARDGRSAIGFHHGDLVRYDLASGEAQERMRAPSGGWLATDRDGRRVALVQAGKAGVTVVDLAAGKVLFRHDGATEVPFHDGARFSPDGSELAATSGDDRIRRYDAGDGSLRGEHTMPDARHLMRLCYSGDGNLLAAVARQSTAVRVFDLRDGATRDEAFELPSANDSNATIAAIALDRGGDRLAIGTWQGHIRVRDRRTGRDRTFQAHSGATWSLCFLRGDPDLLVSSTGAGGITCWDLATDEACYQPWRLKAPVGQVQVSDDGDTLACVTERGAMVMDLAYREHHVASILASSLERWRGRVQLPAGREAELRAWATAVLARPWPRWH